MDYVALGHWHTYRQCGGRACYSGPPELLAEGEEGRVLLVELGEDPPRLEARPLGRRHCEQLEVPLTGLSSVEAVAEVLRGRRDADLVLGATLTGLRPLDLALDATVLAQELAPYFFALRLEDRSHPALAPEEIAALPDQTVLGQFARRLSGQITAASGEQERRVAEAALQLGLALLQGRRVL
jgi:hypothetical protein